MFKKPQKEPERVKREEWDTPSGRHAVSVELCLDSEQAAQAVAAFVEKLEDFKKSRDVESVVAHANWAGDYIAALVTTEMIKPEQADELQKLTDHIAEQTLNNLNWFVKNGRAYKGKRG